MFCVGLYNKFLLIFWSGRSEHKWYAKPVEVPASAIYTVHDCVVTQSRIAASADIKFSENLPSVPLQTITVELML